MNNEIKKLESLLEKKMIKEDMFEGNDPLSELIEYINTTNTTHFMGYIEQYASTKSEITPQEKNQICSAVINLYKKELNYRLQRIKNL